MDEGEWENLADWYDEKQGETGDLWHRALIDAVLVRLVGDPKDRNILDLGCGNGYLSRRFARQGAKMTAVDRSARMIENAKKHDPKNELGINYIVANANHLGSIDGRSFDAVFANMSLMDIEDGEGAISEVSRVLKKGGRFTASISHPCFDNGSNSSWIIEKSLFDSRTYRRIRAYRKPFKEEVPWRVQPAGDKMYTSGFHRPLSWYASVIAQSGLAIVALAEPEPTQEFIEKESDSPGFAEVPLHLVICALKL